MIAGVGDATATGVLAPAEHRLSGEQSGPWCFAGRNRIPLAALASTRPQGGDLAFHH
jgi:hypothetical protein